MPRKYVRKTNRCSIDENSIKLAILDFFNGNCSEREAARIHGIRRSTLQSRVNKILKKKTKEQYLRQHLRNQDDSGNESELDNDLPKYSSKYTNRQVFNTEEEMELERYIKRCSDINYGLTYVQIQKLAYEYAIVLPNCVVPKEWCERKQAKEGWRRGFMARHKSLSLRKPENTSLSRSTAFNKYMVDQFFDNLKKVLDIHKFPAERIFNLDETGVTTVMKPVKIVSTTGKKQVSQAASAERGELVTFVGIINASGQSIPPVYVFPRVRNIDEFMSGAPVSSLALGNKSGWMTADLFPSVLKHIVAHVRCTVAEPILLLVDNHESHVSVTCVQYCKENGIILLSFAPHTTHRMQPLDVGVYGPFKNYCSIAFNDWMTSNPGKRITLRNIAELTNRAYLRAFTASNIISSFRKPGIFPFNRLAFTVEDFSSSYVTGRPPPEKSQEENKNEGSLGQNTEYQIEEKNTSNRFESRNDQNEEVNKNDNNQNDKNGASQEIHCSENTIDNIVMPMPSCSGINNNNIRRIKLKITPESIKPYPKVVRKDVKSGRKPGLSRIYTDTPEKERLEEIEMQKQNKKNNAKKHLFNENISKGKEIKRPPKKNKEWKQNLSLKRHPLKATYQFSMIQITISVTNSKV